MRRRLLVGGFLAAAVAHVVIFAPLPLPLRAGAALILTGLLPGLLLVEALVGSRDDAPLDFWERALYSVGAGAALIVVTMLLLSYLPGPILRWQTLAAFDGLLLILAGAVALHRPRAHSPAAASPAVTEWSPVWTGVARGWFLAGLLTLLLVAGFLRLPNLHYSEFQGDETRALLRTAEAIQGYRDALMTHKKGPGEILLPASHYVLVDRINEVTARLPFALLNLTGLLAVFLLGWRMFGPRVGWVAAMFLALDGYFIGFARIVQYQSMVFCLVVLTVLVLYRLVRVPRRLPNFLTLAALFLGTAMLAHYEGALAVIPGLFLLFMLWRRGVALAALGRALIAPVLVGGAILAAFYVPFVLNPAFAVTYAYITVNRIGTTFPYNNLADFFGRTTLYNTTYALLLWIALTVAGVAVVYARHLPRGAAWAAGLLVAGGMAVSLAQPTWLTLGGQDQTWGFFALVMLSVWLMPRLRLEERTVWLWFGAPMLFMLFFTLTPNTHVYGFIMGWSLVIGWVVSAGYTALAARLGSGRTRALGSALAAGLILLFGNYATWYFVLTDLEVLRNWRTLRPAGYWVTYDMPTNMSIFGFPLRNGWKAVGALTADGVLDAPFALHGKEPVADWYTRGLGYCPRDHEYYLWHESVEPLEQGYNTVIRQQIEEQGYQLFGEITVNDQPRLAIYKRSDAPLTPQRFAVEEVEARFDADLSGPRFEEDGPVGSPQIDQPLDFRMGESIRLLGYSLRGQDNVPGGGVWLTLYWQATAPMTIGYSVFTQIVDPVDAYKAGQRDGEPVCNLLPTNTWRLGDVIADRYYIPLATDARPGTYQLLIGMYDREAGTRLEIFAPDGARVGDALGIDEVRVTAP